MGLRMPVMLLLCSAIACSVETPELTAPTPEAFAGEWRSVTPSLEFVGFSVAAKSSEMGGLAARLAFSGVSWEGSGRIAGDSLVIGMTVVGAGHVSGALVAHLRDARTLRAGFKPDAGAMIDLTFVRD
jgi:hypothetical protein